MRVAVLYIGIGKYISLWNGFYLSCEQYFLPTAEKQYFVFTDAGHFPFDNNQKVKKIFQPDMGWPGNTLLRFHFFMRIVEDLKSYDYVYFFNGNVLFLTPISEDEFCPQDDQLLVVGHNWFWDKNCFEFSYDRNKESAAYIPYGEGKYYVTGAINGAKSEKYISFIKELYNRTERDNSNGVVALWHDESHLNRYIIDYPNIMLLPPEYFYPEIVWNPGISGIRRILARDKRKYFDIYSMKEPEKEIEQLKNDSKHNLYEETQRKVFEKWLCILYQNKIVSEFFLRRGINTIAMTGCSTMGNLFYNDLTQFKAVSIKKVIPYFQSINERTFEQTQCQCLVVTDVYSFSQVYETVRPFYSGAIFSLEDIINELYEEIKDELTSIYEEGFPFNLLPKKKRIVLMGAGKIGKQYYQTLKKSDFKLKKWIDTKLCGSSLFGKLVVGIDDIDEDYDYLVLGTVKDSIAESMAADLKKADKLDKRVIWYDRSFGEWVRMEK